jgi:ABC-type transport system involved in multi-copper enzyme maturation permease subunit
MFAYLLILIVGWLFVAERTQGTLRRLRAAPLTRAQILLGKTLSCFVVSFLQGFLLLLLGKLVFGMRWGPEGWSVWEQLLWLTPVVAATSLSAVGMALLVAAVARTPIQVFIVSAVVVLVSVLIIIPNVLPYMMPEEMKVFTLVTPHAWALEAYTALLPAEASEQVNLLTVPESWWNPNVWDWTAVVYFFKGVVPSCVVLSAFGVVFLALAWWIMPLD